MTLARDFFVAQFGDDFLEFEFAVEDARYDPQTGTVEADWSLEKTNDVLGGITFEVLFLGLGGSIDEYERTRAAFVDSGTLTVESQPGADVDLVVYDMLNNDDREFGDGFTGPGAGQVAFSTPDPPVDPEQVSVTGCDAPSEVVVGEQATISATVVNENFTDVDGEVEVTFGDTVETVPVSIEAESEATVTVTFEPQRTGEVTPAVEVDVVGA